MASLLRNTTRCTLYRGHSRRQLCRSINYNDLPLSEEIKVRSSKGGNDTSLKLGRRPLLVGYLIVLDFDAHARQAISRTLGA
jgi:hypothetical protein